MSLAILLVSLAALGQSITSGSRAATQSRLQTQAVLFCETKLAEVLAGIEPMQPVDGAPLEETSTAWTWSLNIAAGPHPDLLDLDVSVTHQQEQTGTADATYSLRRYVRDPQLYIDAAAEAATAESE